MVKALTPDMLFEQAAAEFIALRSMAPGAAPAAQYVRKNTEKAWRRHSSSLALFFGGMPLSAIHWYNMRAYQQVRVAGDPPFIRKRRPHEQPAPCPVLPQQVNQELGFLKRLKKMALCWSAEDQLYFMELQDQESEVLRCLTPEEQARWLDVSRSRARWELVHWYSLAAFDTTMSTNELRLLQIGNINLQQRMISVPWPAAKNKYRKRLIALESADVLWAFDRLLGRAAEMGAHGPLHYLFPFRITRALQCYPDRPMTDSGLKRVWQEVRDATGLTWFRPYDTRHTGATRLAEQGTPVDIIMARMGHASKRMHAHYTHISVQAQRRWLRGTPERGYAPRTDWPELPPGRAIK